MGDAAALWPASEAEPATTLSLRRFVDLVGDILERTDVTPEDDFFQIGGSSMSAISLVLEIERLTGRELSLPALYNNSTIGQMHALLEAGDHVEVPFVLLRRGDMSRRVFFVHGLGGSTIELRDVAVKLGSDLTVYGIQAPGLDGGDPVETIEAMADIYVDQVLRLDPEGPYRLVGYSLGGLIAFEMARRLAARGLDVAFLGLVDSYPSETLGPRSVLLDLLHVLRMPGARRRSSLKQARWSTTKSLRRKLGLDAIRRPHHLDLPASVQRVRAAAIAARRHYRPSALHCDVTLFEADISLRAIAPNPARHWRHLVKRLTIETVPGDHLTMVQGEAGAVLGRTLDRHLRRS